MEPGEILYHAFGNEKQKWGVKPTYLEGEMQTVNSLRNQ